jgi:hypothetical protein
VVWRSTSPSADRFRGGVGPGVLRPDREKGPFVVQPRSRRRVPSRSENLSISTQVCSEQSAWECPPEGSRDLGEDAMSSRQATSRDSSDGRKRTARAAAAWGWLTSPHVSLRPVARTGGHLGRPALTGHTPANRFGATAAGRLRLQATCDAVTSGYLQGESMARFLTGQYPYDSEQLDSALSRGEFDWPRHQCGADEIP